MNETVKDALLAERRDAQYQLEECESSVRSAQRRLGIAESALPQARDRLADVEAFLRDNGVDLAAVDAGTAQKPSAMQCGLATGYGQGISNLGSGYANGAGSNANNVLSAVNQYDATAGLVKALDEA